MEKNQEKNKDEKEDGKEEKEIINEKEFIDEDIAPQEGKLLEEQIEEEVEEESIYGEISYREFKILALSYLGENGKWVPQAQVTPLKGEPETSADSRFNLAK